MAATSQRVAGIEPGQRRLNGPQTSGREYRNLSEPRYGTRRQINVRVPVRDGIELVADVYRPDADGTFPALVAASPYARQLQDVGIPAGFIEAGATDFWVPRGYVHVIVNLRGTGGSGGEFGFFDSQERRDMYDLIEWVAEQPWCDGNVGMIGISYFAMTQLEAAVERPPHLRAIFPFAVTADLYEAASHHGLVSAAFISSFLVMLGLTAPKSDRFFRSAPFAIARRVLNLPRVHRKFATLNGESAKGILDLLMRLPHRARPWDELWLEIVVRHPVRDEWWDDRDLTPRLENVDIPVYLGCDWENAPLHLPSTFAALTGLTNSPCVRVAMLGKFGLTWPWESMHLEALAWYDHWLKGHDTGILDGPAIRYLLPEADDWHAVQSWPPPQSAHREYALRADGVLDADEGEPGSRTYLTLGSGLNRPKPSEIDPPSILTWTSAPLDEDLDVVGDIELRLVASATALDTAWIAVVSDIAEDDSLVEHLSCGLLRASLREVDEKASRPGAPVLPCRTAVGIPIGEDVLYRIPLVPNARRFRRGHRIRLTLSSDDSNPQMPAIMEFRHATVGTSSLNTIRSSSRLLLPILGGGQADS
ncbi:CocE/NonD family hydrolase [Mycobacterium vicinigordonae]|uniref:CocE/NonD family hydrolase n=1 Tax=Mycobacterium vicinigordonae TaxID=1719132 RepID=A0A7D6IAT1_9MYCO|nr:CocE/NonD family hydrolase [Mycobacterium vicinigordonae]QLL09976.1 CocE/NonD family hydrolase [Mycobacterium vicinigordonae]